MDALKRRHLRALRFGISLDEAGRQQVIEEFEFSFDYGRDGSIAAVNVGVAAARMENRTCGKRAEESEQPIPARPAQRPEASACVFGGIAVDVDMPMILTCREGNDRGNVGISDQ